MQTFQAVTDHTALFPTLNLETFVLSHAQAPQAGEKVLGVTRHHPQECEYEICAPQDAGMPLEELRAFLAGTADPMPAVVFIHPYFDGDEQTPEGCLSPLFSEDMATPDFALNPGGLKATSRNAEYLLIAKNEAGIPAGYIHFSIAVVADLDEGQESDELARHTGLVMTLKRIFVRQSDRGAGIATALLEKAGFVMWSEMRDLAHQVRGVLCGLDDGLVLHPFVMSSWYSRAGKMAHYRLVDLVKQYRDAASDDFANDQFTIAEVCEHGQY